MSKMPTPFVAGFFKDPNKLKHACKASTDRRHVGHDAFTPYPMHGLEDLLGFKRSLLGRPVLFLLLFGAFCGFMMQYWMMKVDWPINIAGKPYNSWPAYVVITFEAGVLTGALGNMALALLVFCKIFPSPDTKVLKLSLTDDTYCLAIPIKDNGSEESLKQFLAEQGAEDIELFTTEEVESPITHGSDAAPSSETEGEPAHA